MSRARTDELPHRPIPGLGRRLLLGSTIVLLCARIIAGLLSASPWPSALVIRRAFTQGAAHIVTEMTPFAPTSGISATTGLRYAPGSPDTTFDVFRPDTADAPLPAVVWIHGGAWISGAAADVAPYLRILASHGYAAVGLNYTVGPEAGYPTAIRQLNDALAYLAGNATSLGIDPTRIVLAGDSAGAQLASQLAVLTTNPDYARLLGIVPALRATQLSGVILNCGVYDLDALADLTGIRAWGFKTALWSYAGAKDWSHTYVGAPCRPSGTSRPTFHPPTSPAATATASPRPSPSRWLRPSERRASM
ncbi:alpha/beta hydrolase [Leifsonia sp. EB34]|uniref:alpha/beta hydrolase n=1 Tax=Leifsonia sp. EB34 TaxID=3156303 RepID=UPI003517AC92